MDRMMRLKLILDKKPLAQPSKFDRKRHYLVTTILKMMTVKKLMMMAKVMTMKMRLMIMTMIVVVMVW
jgi:hypothetical protein